MNPVKAARRAARVCRRLASLCVHLSWGLLLAGWLRSRLGPSWFRHPRGETRRRRWQQALGDILGLRVHIDGRPMDERGLLVANHVSWLDIVAIASATPTTFLAKDDVRAWPIVGWLGQWSGTIFLRRANLGALGAAIDALVEVIEHGQRVALFPEGTTSEGRGVGPFHRGLFQAAVKTGAPVQAIAVRYRRAGELDAIAPFIGEDAFVPHLLRVMAEPNTEVQLHFQAPLHGRQRRDLALRAEGQVRAALGVRDSSTLPREAPGAERSAALQPRADDQPQHGQGPDDHRAGGQIEQARDQQPQAVTARAQAVGRR